MYTKEKCFEGKRIHARKNKKRDRISFILGWVISFSCYLALILTWLPDNVHSDNGAAFFLIIGFLLTIIATGVIAIMIRSKMKNPDESKL